MEAPVVHRSKSRWSRDGRRARDGGRPRARDRRALLGALTTMVALAAPAAALAGNDPVFRGSVANAGTLSGATAVAVAGNFAYTTAYGPGQLTAVDISNPSAPAVAGASAPSVNVENASGISIANGFAYVVSKNRNGPCTPGPAPSCGAGSNDDGSGNSLTIFDIHSNPAQPAIVGTPLHDALNLFGAYGIAVSGTDAFVAAQGCLSSGGQPCPNSSVGNSFSSIDVSNPAAPTRLFTLRNSSLPAGWTGTNALWHADSVAVSNGFAYVTAFNASRLTVLDVGNPAAPRIAGSLLDSQHLSFPNDVAVQGNYAYVADQNSASSNLPDFTVVDISNPAAPHAVAWLTDPDLAGAYRIRVSGDFAYVAASSAGANDVIDISDPLHPQLIWRDPDGTHLNHTTGVSLDSTGTVLVGTSPLQQGQSTPLYPPFPSNVGTVATFALEPSPLSVQLVPGSEPPATTTSTTASFQFVAGNTVEVLDCSLDGQPFSLCSTPTSQAYSGLVDGSHTFTVEGIGPAGDTATASYTWTVGTGAVSGGTVAPANTGAPAITGTATVGQTLATTGGTWSGSPAPALAFQWQRCNAQGTGCAPIAGATSGSYVLTGDDKGSTIVVVVTATNAAGSVPATSAATAVVRAASTGGTGPTGPTGPTGGAKAKIQTLTLTHRRGTYTLHLTLSAATTVKVTLRRTSPRRAVVETVSKKLARGPHTITLKLRASAAAARYKAVVKAPGNTRQLTFTVRR